MRIVVSEALFYAAAAEAEAEFEARPREAIDPETAWVCVNKHGKMVHRPLPARWMAERVAEDDLLCSRRIAPRMILNPGVRDDMVQGAGYRVIPYAEWQKERPRNEAEAG